MPTPPKWGNIINRTWGSPMPSMHDLVIRYTDRAPGAVEVTAAGDPILIETWKRATGGGRWIVDGIAGDMGTLARR